MNHEEGRSVQWLQSVGQQLFSERIFRVFFGGNGARSLVGLRAIFLTWMILMTPVASAASEVLIDGLAWRQLTDTAAASLSWNDVATVCPLNETPCNGSVNGVDFTGWIWASEERVLGLMELLAGVEVPFPGVGYETPVEQVYDIFDPVLAGAGFQISFGLFSLPEGSAGPTVRVMKIEDAQVSAGSDKITQPEVAVTDTLAPNGYYGSDQTFGVFLVRDPNLELCANGIDDDGDALIDSNDSDCISRNPVVDGREWRQVTDTQGLDFWEIANACPSDGTPCSGSVGDVDLATWVWASSYEVNELLLSLVGVNIGAGASIYPWNSPALAPIFSRFAATYNQTTGDFRIEAIWGRTFDSFSESQPREYPTLDNTYYDPLSCQNGLDDNSNGDIDLADPFCLSGQYISLNNGLTEAARYDTMTASSGGVVANLGYFMYRTPMVSTAESCDNTFDDDGDGLIDGLDDDCRIAVNLSANCMHNPVYVPGSGEVVTIRANAIDRDNGQPVVADNIEIYLGFDKNSPQQSVSSATFAELEYPPGGSFSYSCSVTLGNRTIVTPWHKVTVGDPDPSFPAIPVLYQRPLDEAIDIVFFPDQDEYTGWNDPKFIEDVGLLIQGGYLSVPWLALFQDRFNFWVAKETANTGPDPADTDASDGIDCLREKPEGFKKNYNFAASSGFVHRSTCRDNAGSPGTFTIEVDLSRLQVLAHESGHRPFGLADEYCCDGGYFTRQLFGPPYPNMFKHESGCRNKGEDRGYDPNACRSLIEVDTDKDWWLFEPDYDDIDPEPGDLMQQQGCESFDSRAACDDLTPTYTGLDDDPNGVLACTFPLDTYLGNPDGIDGNGDETYWVCRTAGDTATAVWQNPPNSWMDRYDVGDSERDRMSWFIGECAAGRC